MTPLDGGGNEKREGGAVDEQVERWTTCPDRKIFGEGLRNYQSTNCSLRIYKSIKNKSIKTFFGIQNPNKHHINHLQHLQSKALAFVIEDYLDLGCTFYTTWRGGRLAASYFGHFFRPRC